MSWFRRGKVDYIELTAAAPHPPEIRVVSTTGNSVSLRASAVPFCVTYAWGTKEAYEELAFGLNFVLNFRYDREYNLRRSIQNMLHPKVPNGRIVRYFTYESGKRREVLDPKKN